MEAMSSTSRIDTIKVKLRRMMPEVSARYQVREIALFGSFVRQDDSPDSDLDILVSFHEPPSLLKFLELQARLSDSLGVKVDLVMKEALKPRIGERILREVVSL
jgi:predicted nucleotidyltransferase